MILSIPIFESTIAFLPKVTIAIPTYKRAVLLREALDSALNQKKYDNYDVIVVDNNPERDDETEVLLKAYSDSRLSYYKNIENLGMAGNWTRLYALAKGEWVVMLHDDDLLYDDYLYYLFDVVMTKHHYEYDAYHPSFHELNTKKNSQLLVRSVDKLYATSVKPSDFYYGNILGAPVGLCIRKGVVEFIGGISNKYYPVIDLDFYKSVSQSCKMLKLSGYPLCIYRVQENESCKMETVRGFASSINQFVKDSTSNLFFGKKVLWKKYADYLSLNLLLSCKKVYMLDELNVNRELIELNIYVDKISRYVYILMSYYYRFKKRLIRKKIDIV